MLQASPWHIWLFPAVISPSALSALLLLRWPHNQKTERQELLRGNFNFKSWFLNWFQKEGEKKKSIMSICLWHPSSLPGGCDGRARSPTEYHVLGRILIFSGSDGENGEEEGIWWERRIKEQWYELLLLLRQGWWRFLANPAPVHMVASQVTSRSVQTRYLLWHRELNHGNSIRMEPVLVPLTSPLHSRLMWDYSQNPSIPQFHNNPTHEA